MKSGVEIAYIVAAFLFIFGLKQLSSPETARRGNLLSALGMLLAVIVTLLNREILDYRWIGVGLLAGTIIGALAARLVAMTAMPGMVGLLNGSGGLASLLVAWEAYHHDRGPDGFTAATIVISADRIMTKDYWAELTEGYTLRIRKHVAAGEDDDPTTMDVALSTGERTVTSLVFIASLVALAHRRAGMPTIPGPVRFSLPGRNQ